MTKDPNGIENSIINADFSETYKEEVFFIWYRAGRPSIKKLIPLLQPAEDKRIPKIDTLRDWHDSLGWTSRADVMDAEVARDIEQTAIHEKIEMIRRHAETSQKLITLGMTFLEKAEGGGINKAADAIRAVVQGMEIERVSRGLQIALGEIEGMTNEDLVRFVEKKMNPALGESSVDDDFVEGESTDA
jgi:hypothetical protein